MKIRTRFAPSPTGFLHIGAVRTVLFCYALSKKNNGDFIVRIEDTDEKRRVEGAVEQIYKGLDDLGLVPDESSVHGGEFGPYIQSERKENYKEYAQKLIDSGSAYYCFLENEELEKLKEEFKGRGFRSPYRDQEISVSEQMIKDGKSFTVRLKVPNGEIMEYKDGLQGAMRFNSDMVGDEILIKSSGMASYHLAVVVDDFLMKVSHVFRGIEWLPSTPKQILINRFLGLEMPGYYHLPIILDPEGGKLSKRKGAVAIGDFFEQGYLKEAILNFLMLLGWSSPEERIHGQKEREIYSLEEFIELFDLKNLNKSNGVFNREKLLWFNKEYIKLMPSSDLMSRFVAWVEKYKGENELTQLILSDYKLDKKIELVRERAKTLSEIFGMLEFFYVLSEPVEWEISQLDKVRENISDIKNDIKELFVSFDGDSGSWTHEAWEEGMRAIGDKYEMKHGDVFMVLRVAVCGQPFSPPLFESLQILGKDEVLRRLAV